MIPVINIGGRAIWALEDCPGGRVLARFRSACYLLTDAGALIVLATPEAGPGPLNVVAQLTSWRNILPETPFALTRDVLALGPLRLDLSTAAPWESQPDWTVLAARRAHIRSGIRAIEQCLQEELDWRPQPIWRRSLTRGEPAKASTPGHRRDSVDLGLEFAVATTAVIAAYAAGDRVGLERALQALCGLGPGLTPAGDDWLAGWLLGLRLADPAAADRCRRIVADAAVRRTTLLSRAYLACAAAGETDAAWRALLDQLYADPPDVDSLLLTTRKIASRGATSGAAMLSGFIATLTPVLETQPCPS